MCRVPPPLLPFPYQPPVGISQCCPQPPLFAPISITIWSVHWTLTPHRRGLLHFLLVGSAESCSSGSDKGTHSLTVNFDTSTVTCCLLRHVSLPANGRQIFGIGLFDATVNAADTGHVFNMNLVGSKSHLKALHTGVLFRDVPKCRFEIVMGG